MLPLLATRFAASTGDNMLPVIELLLLGTFKISCGYHLCTEDWFRINWHNGLSDCIYINMETQVMFRNIYTIKNVCFFVCVSPLLISPWCRIYASVNRVSIGSYNAGPPVSFEGKKRFLKRLISLKKKVKKKRFSNLRIKPLKYADRLKGTPCDQS